MNEEMITSLIQREGPEFNQAIEALYNMCFPTIKKWIMKPSHPIKFKKGGKYYFKKQGTKQDAEDMFQDALVILLERLKNGKLKLTSSICAFLFGVVKRLWADKQKGGIIVSPNDISDFEHLPFELNQDDDIKASILYRKLATCLNQLSSKCRGILIDVYVHKYSMKEIAEKYGYENESTARTTKYNCLKKLKACVAHKLKTKKDDGKI